uniref:Uncharacterized protein n=1 Tax=Romanomermis culicivorax TaxID=13658 RepID=A0A915J3C9_ROMCU
MHNKQVSKGKNAYNRKKVEKILMNNTKFFNQAMLPFGGQIQVIEINSISKVWATYSPGRMFKSISEGAITLTAPHAQDDNQKRSNLEITENNSACLKLLLTPSPNRI